MKKFFKIIFSRSVLVGLMIVLQVLALICLPFVLNSYFNGIFSHVFVSINYLLSFWGIVLTLRVINSDMNVEGVLSWSILLLLLPVVGISVYYIFVRYKAPKRHRVFYKKVAKEAGQYQVKYAEEDKLLREKLGKYYGQFEYIYRSIGLKAYTNTNTQYMSTGETFFEELKKELVKAEKYIFMEYFIIERGQMWDEILNILKRKVSEGVEVRVMYDDLGTIYKLPNNYCKKLNKMGIKCVRFNYFAPITSAFHNNRDHRKITVIDGKVGFMSGANLADEYINKISPFGYWKDTAVKLSGDAVDSLVLMFLQLFCVQNQKLEDFSVYITHNTLNRQISLPMQEELDCGVVCPYGDGPKYFYDDYVAENVYLNLINQAEKYIYITTPYLIIDSKLTTALTNASKRGVDVRIITPHIPDKKNIFAITRSSYKGLQAGGVKIFEYKKGFVHSKQVICDDEIAILGTINFDYRSLLHHYECATLMYNTACIPNMKKDFIHMLNDSIDMKDFKQNPLTRLFCAVTKVFRPLL